MQQEVLVKDLNERTFTDSEAQGRQKKLFVSRVVEIIGWSYTSFSNRYLLRLQSCLMETEFEKNLNTFMDADKNLSTSTGVQGY